MGFEELRGQVRIALLFVRPFEAIGQVVDENACRIGIVPQDQQSLGALVRRAVQMQKAEQVKNRDEAAIQVNAVFVPPIHTSLPELMSDLERFANDSLNPLPDLLKIAIIHYQFETIHPFLDGNGRVGRLMITLYLVSRGILKQPVLYLSDFFEKHRTLYYDNLMRVRTHNDLNQWLKFFLRGVIETARKGVETFDKILQLQKHTESKIKELGTKGKNTNRVIDFLYRTPVIRRQIGRASCRERV